jgi:hypothetical protein
MEGVAKHVYDWLDVTTKNERASSIDRRMAGITIAEMSNLRAAIARLEAELERVRGEREAWIGGMLAVGAMRWQPHRAEFCLDIRDIEGIRDERERNAVKAAIAKVHRGCFRDHSDAALSARQNNDAVNAAGGE